MLYVEPIRFERTTCDRGPGLYLKASFPETSLRLNWSLHEGRAVIGAIRASGELNGYRCCEVV